jgi:Flp pilus assembly protein TadB
MLLAGLLFVLAAALVLRSSTADSAARRVATFARPASAADRRHPVTRAQLGTAACVMVALAVVLLVPGPARFPAGALAFLGTRAVIKRLPQPAEPQPPPHLIAAGADLLAACLDAGATPATALGVTGRSLPDPLGPRLTEAGRALRSGTAIERALPESGALAPLASVFRRSAQTGSSMSGQLVAVADQLRSDEHFERLERARKVGVLSALPLGLCMLPAFLLLAVVPAVIGLGAGILH